MDQREPTPETLKEILIGALNLEGMTPDMIESDQPLVGEGLGLDSVDALELVVALEKEFGIKIRSEELDREVFASLDNLSKFVEERLAASRQGT